MASSLTNIPKLNSRNFCSWQSDIKYVLMERGLWEIVSGEEKCPEVKPDESEKGVIAKEAMEFKKKSNMALSIIYLNVESDYRNVIEGYTDPIKVWEVLYKHFFPDSKSFHMELFSQLCHCKIQINEAVDMYAARLKRIYEQIKGINKDFQETYVSFQLLRFLPSRFDSIVQNILRWDDTKFIFSDIVDELVAEDTRLKLREKDRGIERNKEVYFTGGQNNSKPWHRGSVGHRPGQRSFYRRNSSRDSSKDSRQHRDPAQYNNTLDKRLERSPSPKVHFSRNRGRSFRRFHNNRPGYTSFQNQRGHQSDSRYSRRSPSPMYA